MSETPENTGENRDEKGKFKPGHSGNPDGKPKGALSITAEIKKKLKEIPIGQKATYLEILVAKILKKAVIEENEKMIESIWKYVDGLPKQGLTLGLEEEIGEVKIHIIKTKDDIRHRRNKNPKEELGGTSEKNEDSN